MNRYEWKTIVSWAIVQSKSDPDFWSKYSIAKDQWFDFEIKKGCCNTDWVRITYKDFRRLKITVKLRKLFDAFSCS